MTFEDLLRMRTDLFWPEWAIPFRSAWNPHFQMVNSDDPVQFVLDRSMRGDAGTGVCYNTGVSISWPPSYKTQSE